jgi:protein-disulfide isomerase
MDFHRLAIYGYGALLAAAVLAAPAAAEGSLVFKDDRTMGSAAAPVVLIEYAAPVCPHCARFAESVFPQIKKAYIDTGKVLYVLRIFPISALDGAVAGMAKCMPDGRYFEFIDLAFRRQDLWDPDGNKIPDVHAGLLELGRLAGLSPQETDRCMQDRSEETRVNRIADDGENKYGVNGVPTLVLNGTPLNPDKSDWANLQTCIDALLVKGKN